MELEGAIPVTDVGGGGGRNGLSHKTRNPGKDYLHHPYDSIYG